MKEYSIRIILLLVSSFIFSTSAISTGESDEILDTSELGTLEDPIDSLAPILALPLTLSASSGISVPIADLEDYADTLESSSKFMSSSCDLLIQVILTLTIYSQSISFQLAQRRLRASVPSLGFPPSLLG